MYTITLALGAQGTLGSRHPLLPISSYCYDKFPGKVFEDNVEALLHDLGVQRFKDKLYALFTGRGANTAYGECYCHGLAAQQDCGECTQSATDFFAQSCFPSKKGIAWFKEYCMLRYSDLEEYRPPGIYKMDVLNVVQRTSVSDVIDFDKKLSPLMDQIFAQAANGSSNPS